MLLTIALTVMTVSAQDVVTNIVPTDADEAAFSTNTTATNISETIPAPAETSAMSSTPDRHSRGRTRRIVNQSPSPRKMIARMGAVV
ncbi:MAG: hypothetical protein NTZ16_05395 [Verrucomicrobia bacterium]|nr:hypothetical protein [Verrucomicrobiota bacterium]